MDDDVRRVLLVFGGRCAEHPISIQSARNVADALARAGYDVPLLGIDRDGRMHLGRPGQDPARVVEHGPITDAFAAFDADVVFPLVHGPMGEDGTLQGLCEVLGVPYVGSGVLASAVCMDKVAFKALVTAACPDVPVAPWVAVDGRGLAQGARQVEASLKFPVFVKPANMGSSIGISRVEGSAWLRAALEAAARYDDRILVEQAVDRPREIELALLGDAGGDLLVSQPGEIVLPPDTWYDYETKYEADVATYTIPADLPPATAARLDAAARAVYRAADCAGMARVDFLLDRTTGVPVLNEVNTIPGFTAISMYPKLMAHAGLDGPALVRRLCQLAIERHRRRRARPTAP